MKTDPRLLAVLRNPGNAEMKRAYGEFLKDKGDPHGVFILLQCEIHDLIMDGASCDHENDSVADNEGYIGCSGCHLESLKRWEDKMVAEYFAAFGHPASTDLGWHVKTIGTRVEFDSGAWIRFRCGFVHDVACTLETWISQGPAIVAEQPVEMVHILDKIPESNGLRASWTQQIQHECRRDRIDKVIFGRLLIPEITEKCTWISYDSPNHAVTALSDACLRYARRSAGLIEDSDRGRRQEEAGMRPLPARVDP